MEQPAARTAQRVGGTLGDLLLGMTSQQMLDAMIQMLASFPQDRWDLTPKQRVDLSVTAQTATSRMQALAAVLLAEADKHDAFRRATGSTTSMFIADKTNLSTRQAAGLLFDAQRLGQHPVAQQAALSGEISMPHANAVGRAMEQMPEHFTPTQKAQAETLLVDLAGHHTPDDVVKEAARVSRQVDPVDADDREKACLAQERRIAWQSRSLNFARSQGSLTFHGSLPLVEGQAFRTLIDAYAQQARRDSIDNPATGAEDVTPLQRRADALISLTQAAQTGGQAPTLAGDRPVVTVTLDYHKLLAGAADAGLLHDGSPLAAGDLRRLCCDANLIPVVLGGPSEPLDVGRSQRFVTPAIRTALTLRDNHCAFPRCDKPAHLCDAHHIAPWYHGGNTNLDNLVLLCPYHHGLIEPDKHAGREQWTVTITSDGHPLFTPPRSCRGQDLTSGTMAVNQTPARDATAPPQAVTPPGGSITVVSMTTNSDAAPPVTAADTADPVFALETRYEPGPDLFTAVSTGPPGTS